MWFPSSLNGYADATARTNLDTNLLTMWFPSSLDGHADATARTNLDTNLLTMWFPSSLDGYADATARTNLDTNLQTWRIYNRIAQLLGFISMKPSKRASAREFVSCSCSSIATPELELLPGLPDDIAVLVLARQPHLLSNFRYGLSTVLAGRLQTVDLAAGRVHVADGTDISWIHMKEIGWIHDEHGKTNEPQEMLDLAIKNNKVVQEKDELSPEKLAIANVGCQDAKKHLKEHVSNLMLSNIV